MRGRQSTHPGRVEHGRVGWAQGAWSTGGGVGSRSSPQSQRRPGPREGEQLADVCGRSEQVLARLEENRNPQESSPQRLELKTFIMSVPGGQPVLVGLLRKQFPRGSIPASGVIKRCQMLSHAKSQAPGLSKSLSKVTLLHTAVCTFCAHLDENSFPHDLAL